MAIVLLAHPLLRRVYNFLRPIPSTNQNVNPPAKAETTQHESPISADFRSVQRTTFDLYFALIFLTVLHGFSAPKILFILYINFNIATRIPKQQIPAATWIFNIGILFVNEFCHGYHYTGIAKTLLPSSKSAFDWANQLDNYGGLIPRWEILFNFTILRLISFNMDYCWSLDRSRSSSPIEVRPPPPNHLTFHYLHLSHPLIPSRRNHSTPPPSPNATASPFPPHLKPTSTSPPTSPTPSTPPSTSPGPS